MTNKVLFVDDEPNILEGFHRHLRKHVEIDTATSGEEGLRMVAANGPYAVVVSDMRMPNMNGSQFLAKVRAVSPDSIRMILSGQADMESTIAAVNDGHIFRFLTKPCSGEQLLEGVDSGLRQYKLIHAEKDLLENTLSSAIRVLTEILGMTNPGAYSRAARIQRYTEELTNALGMPLPWELKLASMLSQLGFVALPADTLAKVYAGQKLSADEQAMFDSHPAMAGKLLAGVPRLETVAEIVAGQATRVDTTRMPAQLSDWDSKSLNIQLLHAASEFDQLLSAGLNRAHAIERLRAPAYAIPGAVLDALNRLPPVGMQTASRMVGLVQLVPGMLLDEDVMSSKGVRLVQKGQEVTRTMLERLHSVATGVGIVEPLRVTVRL
jgi:response regulator RpfG family c-di-GMP phosphodiesterase